MTDAIPTRFILVLTILVLLNSCYMRTERGTAGQVSASVFPFPSTSPGTVLPIQLADEPRAAELRERLRFCVLENGANDLVYVECRDGVWSNGEFDVAVDKSVVFTGRVRNLVFGGVLLEMGDVFDDQPTSERGVRVTRIVGHVL